ncbi:unnamed protein product [Closterium sp. NIES-54]
MATPRVLRFDAEGRPLEFSVWLLRARHLLGSQRESRVTLRPALPSVASSLRSEETHFTQVRTASEFLTAIKARYATPTTVSLGRLFLPFLFPDLTSFERTADLITHLRLLDSSYRTACTDAQLALLPPPMAITIYFIATSLPDRLASVRDVLLLKHPSELTIKVLESALKDVKRNLRSVASASGVVPPPLFHGCTIPQLPTFSASLASAASDVTAAAVTTSSRSWGRSGRRGGHGAGGGGAGGGGDVASSGDGSAGARGAPHAAADDSPAAASGCDARNRTTLTPHPTLVSVALADPTSGPVTARYTTTLPCPALPSGSLTGFHVPSFLRNLVGVRPLVSQHVGVWIEPSGETAVCVDGDTYAPLATFTAEPGSGLCTLHTGPQGQQRRKQQQQQQQQQQHCLHSDRGGEFRSGILVGFFREQGIRQSWTLPESPQQNGVAERRIGLVMEIARTSMNHARAPHFLWPYGVCVPGGATPGGAPSAGPGEPGTDPVTSGGAGSEGAATSVFPPPLPPLSPPLSHTWPSRRSPCARPSSPIPFTDLRTALFCSTPPRSSPSVLPSPPKSALSDSLSTPVTNYYRTYRSVLSRVLASLVTDPRASLSSVSTLTAAVTEFASTRCLDYATCLVAAPPTSPLAVGGESALGCDALEERQFELEFLAAASSHLCAMLLAPEGDPDALDIPTPRTYAEAPSSADLSMFVRRGSTPFFVLVYVDDLVFATADRVSLADVKLELQKRHTCTDLGELRHYLGLQITRDRAARTITLSHSHMVQQVLQRFELQHSNVQRHLLPLTIDSPDPFLYSPGPRLPSSVSTSIAEAEIYAGAMAAQELRWLTFLLTDLSERPSSAPTLFTDNKASILLG